MLPSLIWVKHKRKKKKDTDSNLYFSISFKYAIYNFLYNGSALHFSTKNILNVPDLVDLLYTEESPRSKNGN